MNPLRLILIASVVPVVILNWLAGIVGVIWLICVGEWRIALAAIGVAWLGNWPLTLAIAPSYAAWPLLASKRHGVRLSGAVFSSCFTALAIGAWIFVCWYVAHSVVLQHPKISPFAIYLAAYAATITPLQTIARQDTDSAGTQIHLQCSAVANAICFFGMALGDWMPIQCLYGIIPMGAFAAFSIISIAQDLPAITTEESMVDPEPEPPRNYHQQDPY